ncbi:hypothetical protein BDM02DRAFT_3109068 [Thelephora ganbajun]|uniref:Uncharacterized protein n=1 Tax=Thelephora ganbajun TaxID=370292 RepID=A0ACB6ZSX0_THEGA|nr:hypothetical protein BDM02DRAFT_3109068 [Thelephora ganbajun]
MAQPVTVLSSFELTSKLEELSGLTSQIVRFSNELQAASRSDFSMDSASVCALLPVALSNAWNCLSILQFISQAPFSPPYPLPFVPPVFGSPSERDRYDSPPLPSTAHANLEMEDEATCDALLIPAEPRCGWNTQSRMDIPVVDSRLSTPGQSQAVIDKTRLPVISLDPQFLSRPPTPATQKWPLLPLPLPPVGAISEPSICPTLGDRSTSEYSPLSPLFSHQSPTRHGVSIAELVEEESSSSGTRGGMHPPSRPAVTRANTSAAHSYPPLSISITDATPQPTRREIKPLRSSLVSLPESPTTQVRSSSVSPPVSPASNHLRRAASEGRELPRRSKRKRVLLTTPEVPRRRVTRNSVKQKTSEEFGMEAGKRTRAEAPETVPF